MESEEMTIYKISYRTAIRGNLLDDIWVTPIEVEEKPKSFKIIKSDDREFRDVIRKSELDALKTDFGYSLYSLSPSTQNFRNLLTLHIDKKINDYQKRIEDCEKIKKCCEVHND